MIRGTPPPGCPRGADGAGTGRRLGRHFWFAVAAGALVASGCGGPNVQLAPTDPRYELEVGRAEFASRHWLEAQTHLKKFLDAHPGHALADSAQLLLGLSLYESKSYSEAAVEFAILGREFPRSPLRDDAAYHECNSYAQQMRSAQLDPTYAIRARTCFQEFQLRFPESELKSVAESRVAEIDDRLAEKEYRLGVLFAKMKRPAAARVYLEGLLESYPRSRWVGSSLYWIGRSQEAQGAWTEAYETYRTLQERFPDTQEARDAGERQHELVKRDPRLGQARADSLPAP